MIDLVIDFIGSIIVGTIFDGFITTITPKKLRRISVTILLGILVVLSIVGFYLIDVVFDLV